MRRGGPRPAWRWAALLSAVFALGGGEAAAQLTADGTFDGNGLRVDVASRVTEGASATITVTLKASVRANTATATAVTVTVAAEPRGDYGDHKATNEASDISLNPGTTTVSFPANTTNNPVTHTVSGRIVLRTIDDPDAEDETVVLAISTSGGLGQDIQAGSQTGEEPRRPVTIDDDETQAYVLALGPGAVPREGAAAFNVVVSADPAHVDDSKALTLQIDDTDYVLDTDANATGNQLSGTLGQINDENVTSFTAKVTPPANDGDRTDDAVTVKAYSGTVGNATEEASLTFTVADAHALPAPAAVTVEVRDTAGGPATSVAEGGAVDLTVSVDRGRGATAATGEALSVALALAPADPAHASSYRLTPARVDLPAVATPAGKQTAAAAVRLEALADEFVGDDRLTLNLTTTGEAANGPGSVEGTFAIAVGDTTVKKVSAKSDAAVKQAFDAARRAVEGTDGLNPGEAFTVAGTDLFEGMAAGSTVVYTASSSDPSVRVSTSGAAVTVTAVSAGTATVRVNARVTGPSSVASAVPQTRSDEAAVEQAVTVANVPLSVTLTAAPAAAVEEGGTITLTATANRAVLAGEDATVRLTVIGPVVAPPPASVTIAAGATTAAAVLTVQDDDEVKDLGSVTVVATGGGLAPDPTRLDIAVTEDDVETTYSYTFTATAARVTEGGAVTLAVTATPAVAAETVVALTAFPVSLAADYTLVPLSITLAAGATSGTAELRATDDDEVEEAETLTVTATDPGKVLIGTVEITIVDNDTPAVTVRAKADAPERIAAAIARAAEGGAWTVGGAAATVEMDGLFDVDAGVTAAYQGVSSAPGVVLATTTGNTLSLAPAGAGTATITVTGSDTAGGSPAAVVTHDATVALPRLTMTVTADPAAITEGGTSTIAATASRTVAAADGPVRVNLSVVGAATLDAASIDIAAGSAAGSATLTSTDDGDHEPGGETVTVVASGTGIDGNVSIPIAVIDNDPPDIAYTLSAPADPNVTEGAGAELTVTASRAVPADTEVLILRDRASTAGDADYTVEPATIAAGATRAAVRVTALEDDTAEGGETLTLYAVVGGAQTNPVTLNLWDAAVPALPVVAQLVLAAVLAVGGYRRRRR